MLLENLAHTQRKLEFSIDFVITPKIVLSNLGELEFSTTFDIVK